jgi:hypothetical protein
LGKGIFLKISKAFVRRLRRAVNEG